MRILLITYYWPPAGGAGVQRWLYFAKELQALGYQLTVLTPSNPTYPVKDNSLGSLVEDIEVVQVPILEPYRWARFFSKGRSDVMAAGVYAEKKKQGWKDKLMLWVRGNLFIPDTRKFWKKPVVRRVKKLVQKTKFQVIITNGPPHSVHLVGWTLKKKLGIHWIADFRDPWVEMVYHNQLYFSAYTKKRHRALERKVLHLADAITVTSYSTQRDYQKLTTKPVACLTNGFSEEEIEEINPDPKKFTIAHIGLMMTRRNPPNLWRALEELVQESVAFRQALNIELTGTVSPEVIAQIERHSLTSFTTIREYVPHQEAIKLQLKSNLLLLVQVDEAQTKAALPGKLFEYLSANRPILAIGPNQWDAFQIVRKTQAGIGIQYQASVEVYKKAIRRIYETKKWAFNQQEIAKFSRKEVTKALEKIILQLK